MTADYSFGRAFLDAFVGREPFPEPDPPASARSWWTNFWTALAGRAGLDGDAARTARDPERATVEGQPAQFEPISVPPDDTQVLGASFSGERYSGEDVVRSVVEDLVQNVIEDLNEVDRWMNGLHGTLLALHEHNHLLASSGSDSPLGDWFFSARFAERDVSERRAKLGYLWDQVLGDAKQAGFGLESSSVRVQLAEISDEANLMAAQVSYVVAAASPFFVYVNEFARHEHWPSVDGKQRESR